MVDQLFSQPLTVEDGIDFLLSFRSALSADTLYFQIPAVLNKKPDNRLSNYQVHFTADLVF